MEVIANEGLECWDDDVVLKEKGVVPLEDSFIIAQLLLFVRKMWGNIFYFFTFPVFSTLLDKNSSIEKHAFPRHIA